MSVLQSRIRAQAKWCISLVLAILSQAPASADVQWESFTLKNGHIWFPIQLNGEPAMAMIDSGAEINSISEYYVDQHRDSLRFGDKIRLQGVFGTEEKRLVSRVNVNMFGAELPMKDLVPANLGGAQILLGAPFINNFVLQLDYPNQRLRLLKHEWVDLEKVANVEIKRQKGTSLPAIKVAVGDEDTIWLTFDTGNAGGLFLPRSVAERRGWLRLDSEAGLGFGATGMAEIERFTVPYLKIGPYELENVAVTVPAAGESTSVGQRSSGSMAARIESGRHAQGLLGYDVLKHFVVTLDNKNLKLHLGLPETLPTTSNADD